MVFVAVAIPKLARQDASVLKASLEGEFLFKSSGDMEHICNQNNISRSQ